MVRRRGNNLTQSFKDYGVPLVGVFLIFLLIYSFFSGGSTPEVNPTENRQGLTVGLNNVDSSGVIAYAGGDQKEIGIDTQWYKGEKLLVKDGNITIKKEAGDQLRLSKNGELKYLADGSFDLLSANLWLDSIEKTNINFVFGKVMVGETSHISITQNEVQSSIYLLSGFAEVQNLAGQSTLLLPGEKISIAVAEANDKNFDADNAKQEIGDIFTNSTWYILNNGSAYLGKEEKEITTNTASGSIVKSNNRIIVLNNILDESNVSSENISIAGNYNNTEVKKIILNGQEAKINTENKSFVFENVDTSQRENDLVFKVYDDANDVLEKFVYIVYYAQAAASNSSSTATFQVKNYDVDGSQFTFTSPTSKNTLTTYETFVTIKGKVLAKGVSKVTVNGYTLNSFKGSTWRYHADTKYDNLKNGTNVYEIKYFDANGKAIYTNHYTIIKKDRTATPKKSTKIISGEAKL